ncbi:Cytochrome c oxidase subunit 6B [Claviceps purpurea]|uniref:Cytochrome c oxidase subunit n=1 Tax=Claviceps purpurea (strain 20.1) TaxID=1111077 RepID=M1WBP3_CLAP2|nr:Cytochrome c oxidase subunit 6B [Claviceps purpurea]CCE31178.1 probable COX12-cytochrome-c oxidase, subunit VIB [Claviceps purpurea 20.1]KAG6138489.1 Cytochrome c oxidase subunit 6B [Claviceps purpurea]KAG6147352.1 Cytochrome c oxidase subunit 6B [Claviceps purpurea]KAG6161192.1 Cytochrome c oxidase subunit 6B [Claviceps purpurea]
MSDEEGQELVTKPFKLVTGPDARFPNTNQTKHCWQNYVDYHKCINAKGEDFAPCLQFYHAYRSLCPSSWHTRWDDQREAGNFPAKLDA